MHPLPRITDEQYKRLQKAKETRRYGHLESWLELYVYQKTIGNHEQVKEIGRWATKAKNGKVILPLMRNGKERI